MKTATIYKGKGELTVLTKELKEIIKRIALVKIKQAESFIGSGQGSVKFEYVVNLIISELKKLPLPVYIRVAFVLFQFVLKSDLRKEVQRVFNEIKNEINRSADNE